MTPSAWGRPLPHQDFEGDDFTPGAGGAYVTCMDTATGRAAAWSTANRTDLDGKTIRAAVKPRDAGGINFIQADQALHDLSGLHLVRGLGATQASITHHLKQGLGLVVAGNYWTIPRAYRFQASANFAHAIFLIGINSAGNTREYDPLDPRVHGYGTVLPMRILWPFVASLGYQVAFVPMQHV